MKSYTVNTEGNNVDVAKRLGFHAYYADGVTAIEVHAKDKREARSIVRSIIGNVPKIYYVFE